MAYNPAYCWGDFSLDGALCPIAVFNKKTPCLGGHECRHRGGIETRQCGRPESSNNSIGLCDKCYRSFVGLEGVK